MAYSEDIIKLRKRVLDAVSLGVVNSDLKDFYEATLLQIMNEAERQKQNSMAQAEQLRKQAAIADGQASAYASMSSMVYNVLNAYIIQAERAQAQEVERQAEIAEKESYIAAQTAEEEKTEESVKKSKKK
jgi:hypothetical protein